MTNDLGENIKACYLLSGITELDKYTQNGQKTFVHFTNNFFFGAASYSKMNVLDEFLLVKTCFN